MCYLNFKIFCIWNLENATLPRNNLFEKNGYLVGANLGQLAPCEVCRGLRGCGEATMNKSVQGDQGGQQLILTQRDTESRSVLKPANIGRPK